MANIRWLLSFTIILSLVMPVSNTSAFGSSLNLVENVEQTIDLPHYGVEKMVWSDDGNKLAVLLSHGAYIADARDGSSILEIWGHGNDDEGRLGIGTLFAFTADSEELLATVHTGGRQELVWQQGATSNGAYLFTAVNVRSGASRYIFSDPIYRSSSDIGDVARDGSSLIAQFGTSGYFGVYSGDRPTQATRNIGPILNKFHNAFGHPKLFYDEERSILVLVYIDGEIKVWDPKKNNNLLSFSPSITGFSAAALDRSTGNLCTGGNGLITGAGQDDPNTMVRCWNLETGSVARIFSGTRSGVNSISVSPNGRYVSAIEGGGRLPLRLLLWSSDASEPLGIIDYGRISSLSAVAFSPDGATLAVAVGNKIQIISVPY